MTDERLRAELAEARNAALEEAALCVRSAGFHSDMIRCEDTLEDCAKRIRALKSKPPTPLGSPTQETGT